MISKIPEYNFYCDESGHLPLFDQELDIQRTMVIGTVYCRKEYVKDIVQDIKNIKARHNIPIYQEIKWSKVSKIKKDYYIDLIKYFFENNNLSFRAIVIRDKKNIDYTLYSHDEIYYIMYYFLLDKIIKIQATNHIYIDKKDTMGKSKVKKLKEYLNNRFMYQQCIIGNVQMGESKDLAIMQLTDLLIGSIGYANRGVYKNKAKKEIIKVIQSNLQHSILESTKLTENKFNIFYWNDNR